MYLYLAAYKAWGADPYHLPNQVGWVYAVASVSCPIEPSVVALASISQFRRRDRLQIDVHCIRSTEYDRSRRLEARPLEGLVSTQTRYQQKGICEEDWVAPDGVHSIYMHTFSTCKTRKADWISAPKRNLRWKREA